MEHLLNRPIILTWTDSASFGGWHDTTDVKSLVPDLITSIGFLVAFDDKFVWMAMSLTGKKDGAGDVLIVPRAAVEFVGLLTLPKKEVKK